VVDDAVNHGIVGDEGDDAHLSATSGAGQRVDFEHFPYHLGPAMARDPRALLLDDEGMGVGLCLAALYPGGHWHTGQNNGR